MILTHKYDKEITVGSKWMYKLNDNYAVIREFMAPGVRMEVACVEYTIYYLNGVSAIAMSPLESFLRNYDIL